MTCAAPQWPVTRSLMLWPVWIFSRPFYSLYDLLLGAFSFRWPAAPCYDLWPAAPCYDLWPAAPCYDLLPMYANPAVACDLCCSCNDLWPVQPWLWPVIYAAPAMTCDLAAPAMTCDLCISCYDLWPVQPLLWPATYAAPAMKQPKKMEFTLRKKAMKIWLFGQQFAWRAWCPLLRSRKKQRTLTSGGVSGAPSAVTRREPPIRGRSLVGPSEAALGGVLLVTTLITDGNLSRNITRCNVRLPQNAQILNCVCDFCAASQFRDMSSLSLAFAYYIFMCCTYV
jgi:hypothetical protein